MAKTYFDIVTLRGQKAAYNIEDEQKDDWKGFIANDQFNEILRKVIASVRNNDADMHKSFWISGTYGTGKSHAGAVIKHLLCDELEDITEYVNEEYSADKYEILRNDLFKLRKQKRLFPVMLYGQSSIAHKEDLSLLLQRKITEALKKAGKELTVKTDFENYVSHIENDPDFWDMLIEKNPQLKSISPTRNKLINDLKNGDTSTLAKVREALRLGKYDIRISNADLSQWFFEVQLELAEKTEYNGILVIWDEFTDVMTSDMGLSLLVALQEIDEKIMNPENNSYFLYISHPSALNSLKEDEREKTKGRYHFMGYNMEPVSAFKIMSRKFKVIDENKIEYEKLRNQFYNGRQELLNIYSQTSTNPEETIMDIQNLFPLHPSTANLATYYAREAGSSSRSVFEFLGANKAIRQFLNSEEHLTNIDTITADYLWDYVLDEFNSNVSKYGAVTERFNSHKLQVESKGKDYYAVFKGVLLLNALNNIANNETVTPSEENITNLFDGTSIEPKLPDILNYFDENSIIQRQPGGLFSIQFSALPTKEIEDIKQTLMLTQFRFTSQVINFGDVAKKEIGKFLSNVSRANQFMLYSVDANEYTLLNKIENGYKQAKPYVVFMALLFARNISELNTLKDIAGRVSMEDRFQNVAFIVFDGTLGDKNYERFIEYQANATCAQSHGFADQQKTHSKCASDMVRDWMNEIRRGNFTYYLQKEQDVNATIKIASIINACMSPTIFRNGAESLDLIKTKSAKSYWAKLSAREAVRTILSFNTKTEIISRCGGQLMHIPFLLQDSVDENLNWKDDIDKDHPLLLISKFIDRRFKNTDKNQSFNLGDKLIDLTKPPFGLYQSYAGMGMVAFAMRKYIKQIFDLNGKPREVQHLVDDIVEMFKSWENDKTSQKLNFRFETKESRSLCENFIKLFKLNELKGYGDISSLTDARWAITHEFSREQEFPLWVLKYVDQVISDDFKTLIDNILKICGETDMRNPLLLNDTLDGIKKYRFEFGNLLNQKMEFRNGFIAYLKSIEIVKLQEDEVEDAMLYIKEHLQETVGLWTENEVEQCLTHWRIEKDRTPEKDDNYSDNSDKANDPKGEYESKENNQDNFSDKRISAKNKVLQISDVNNAKKLLEKICEYGNEAIIDLINSYNV
ncbi:MAG: hypothetical protein PHI36_02120 [Bacteroidales bacterium]|nr:hypothetical protein [Bacteroidales bacterium]